MTQKTINSNEALALLEKNDAILIDVREQDEYKAEHIPGAINKPLSSFNQDEVKELAKGKQIIVQCLSGKRALMACSKIGSQDPYVLSNGIEGWKREGLKTIKRGAGITIIRQVMIVAGLLVLIGAVLSIYITPKFIALPIFIGAGLTFSGVTGWCGMAIILSKMPWNRSLNQN